MITQSRFSFLHYYETEIKRESATRELGDSTPQ